MKLDWLIEYIIACHSYELWWNGEMIDTADSLSEAEYLQTEYQLAFGYEHRVTFRRVR